VRAYAAQGANCLVVGRAPGSISARCSPRVHAQPGPGPADLGRTPIVEVADKYVISDGRREVAAYRIDNPHSKSYLLGYVPDAKLGYVTDLWSPDAIRCRRRSRRRSPRSCRRQEARHRAARFAGGHGSTGDFAPLQKLASE